ncbi:MAG: acyltransferase [Treponema sp.]|nr:acyltransferase [Spirochaetia bacterium]MDD7458898.1 acyltransferase [Spirochaetales bacterium]MDY5810477.1 acyltransferase [Treponema sp.]
MLSERKERDSRFELLRIIAMLMIIFHHIMQKTFEPSFITPEVLKSLDAWQTFGARGVYWMGMVGNYCFMMISGWFLCKSKFTMKKWLTLYAEVFFYSVVIGLIMFLTGKSGKVEFAKCFLALNCSGWYIWAYLTFFVTVPFLNKLIENLSKKEHLAIAVFFVLIGNVLPCLWFTKWPMLTGSLFPFYVSYFAASYVRIYGIDFFNNKSRNLVLLILSLAFLVSFCKESR